MSGLTISQRIKIIRSAVLRQSSSQVLAPFEVDLLRDVDARHRQFGGSAVITEREWSVVDAAIGAMAEHRSRSQGAHAIGLMRDVTAVEAIDLLDCRSFIGPGDAFVLAFSNTPEPSVAGRIGRASPQSGDMKDHRLV